MSRALRANYEEQLLFPPCLEDWIPADHPTRFLREFVDSLDLVALGFPEDPKEEDPGRPRYGSDLLLKVWLYGYMNKIMSTRGLEKACREHVSLIWLTGKHEPDHNSLWRFFHTYQKELRKVFREVVQVAVRAGLVSLALHAVDGTKIRSRGATGSQWTKEDLDRLLKAIDASLDNYQDAVETAEDTEVGEYRLPEGLEERRALRRRVKELRERVKQEERKAIHPDDPEARVMLCEGGRKLLAYNGQAAVDRVSGLILGQDVVTDASDNHQLVPVLDQVQEAVGAVADRTVADGAYCSGKTLHDAEEKGYGVLVNLPSALRPDPDKPFASNQFTYDEERDCCICPQGKELPLNRVREKPGRGYEVREYRCQSFRECPVRHLCSRDKQGRRIEISPYDAALRRQRAALEDPQAQEDLRQRARTVEPPFGWIKEPMGFRRFTQWGLEGCRTQWAMLCTAVDLKKLLFYWREGIVTFA